MLLTPILLIGVMLALIPVGFLAALVGIGGGVVVVPLLTLVFGYDVKQAAAIGVVTVVASGITSASRYLKQGLTNLRLAFFLSLSSSTGAIIGAFASLWAPPVALYIALSCVLAYVGVDQVLTRRVEAKRIASGSFAHAPRDALASALSLSGSYFDEATGKLVEYKVSRSLQGLSASVMAGIVSGLLGIGGGVLNVPIMNNIMNVPMKVAVATSKLKVMITACTAALVYILTGRVDPILVAPTVLGVSLGAFMGTKVMNKVRTESLKALFGVLLIVFSYLLLARGLAIVGITLPGV